VLLGRQPFPDQRAAAYNRWDSAFSFNTMGKKGKQSGKRAVPIPVKTVGPSQLEASDVDHIEVADDADKAQVVDRGAGEEGGKASAQGNSHPAAPARAEDGDARALREENDRLRAEVASK